MNAGATAPDAFLENRMKFIKPFYGCKAGEIYPTQFEAGDVCPPELEEAAIACGVVQVEAPEPKKRTPRE